LSGQALLSRLVEPFGRATVNWWRPELKVFPATKMDMIRNQITA
jgi:hypothetical protein